MKNRMSLSKTPLTKRYEIPGSKREVIGEISVIIHWDGDVISGFVSQISATAEGFSRTVNVRQMEVSGVVAAIETELLAHLKDIAEQPQPVNVFEVLKSMGFE